MADVKKKQLVFNIIEFLRTSAQDGTVKEDDKESLEVAVQCIAESFGVDPDSENDKKQYSIEPASLLNILDVFLKTKAKSSASTSTSTPSTSTSASSSNKTETSTAKKDSYNPSEEDKSQAEQLKTKGNQLMSSKLYDSAIEKYTEAIKLYENPIYYSNRAAAWGGLNKHDQAIKDAEKALDLDPNFSKAYSRLGHAHFSSGNYEQAVQAYEDGLKIDSGNQNMKTALATAKSKFSESSSSNSVADREPPSGGAGGAGGMPDLSSLASMFGGGAGGAGGGGAGGMPDLASMMRNPQMMAMAQQMMANGGLERLMQNPALRGMAENMQNGGGMPDMSQLANDPSLRDLAQQFMGGQGGQGRGQ
ncbi:uncharacterized protein L201_004122 [Kwoniella dendrophila CBS 6074]|uniref:SGTA homodimerisation domain-containing protein n=1 Tax=Kwoniella dendrophila CBS 6074 TaxID=1295534 RepID=A0AAX4JV70_9TREE